MANNYWRTPPEIIDYVQSRFGEIKLDVCAQDKKAAVCKNFISEEMDAFKCDWWQLLSVGELMWMNPPYSDPYPWVKKLGEQIKQGNGRCAAGILNLDPSTKWFYELESYATLIMPIIGRYHDGKFKNGRVSFLNESSEPIKGNSKPQFLFYASSVDMPKCWQPVSISELYGI